MIVLCISRYPILKGLDQDCSYKNVTRKSLIKTLSPDRLKIKKLNKYILLFVFTPAPWVVPITPVRVGSEKKKTL